jgi:hypothetical protein
MGVTMPLLPAPQRVSAAVCSEALGRESVPPKSAVPLPKALFPAPEPVPW